MKKKLTNKKLVLVSQTLTHMQLATVAGGANAAFGSASGCITKPIASCPDNLC